MLELVLPGETDLGEALNQSCVYRSGTKAQNKSVLSHAMEMVVARLALKSGGDNTSVSWPPFSDCK